MATIAREYIDDQGRALVEYESGAVAEKASGKLVGSNKPLITADNARDMVARRIAKSEAAIRANIIAATKASGLPGVNGVPIDARSSAEAVGIAAGVLWEQGVLNPDARLKDRVDAFKTVATMGKLVDVGKQAQQQPAEAEVQFLRSTLTNIVQAAMAAAERKQQDG